MNTRDEIRMSILSELDQEIVEDDSDEVESDMKGDDLDREWRFLNKASHTVIFVAAS